MPLANEDYTKDKITKRLLALSGTDPVRFMPALKAYEERVKYDSMLDVLAAANVQLEKANASHTLQICITEEDLTIVLKENK